ncbi:MAG: S41 family peptidase [Planctomycetes bacterium]|nr:S41 family peptidase [Planctomycetota bacterium]
MQLKRDGWRGVTPTSPPGARRVVAESQRDPSSGGGRRSTVTWRQAGGRGVFLGLALLFGVVVGLATAQDEGTLNISEKVAQEVRNLLMEMSRAGPEELWPLERKLELLGGPGARLVKALAPTLAPGPRLACAKMLCAAGENRAGIDLLHGILQDEGQGMALRVTAADLLAAYALTAAPGGAAPGPPPVGDGLPGRLVRLLEKTREVSLRVSIAKALWNTGENEEHQSKAYEALAGALHSPDARERGLAAFALAELFGTKPLADEAVQVLQEFENEPTPEGRRATALLHLHRLILHTVRESQFRGKLSNPLLDELRNKIQAYYVDENLIGDGYLVESASRGMVSALDRFSSYMNQAEWEGFREGMAGEYAGIGASVLARERRVTIEKVIYAGPAYKAGLRTHDEILQIDDAAMEGKGTEDVVRGLRGEAGSTVVLKIRRLRAPEPLTFTVTRESIKIPVAYREVLPGPIGYLRLLSFGDTASEEMRQALETLEDEDKVLGLVLDLRQNPGGLLQAAQEIANRFLDGDKLIVFSKGRNPQIAPRQEFRTDPNVRTTALSLVVLVDGNSASAAEILAGALQDHHRAVLVGQKTFGKGSVQQLMPLDSTQGVSALRLTIAKYYLPSERCIHEIGIQPDVAVEARALGADDEEKLARLGEAPFVDYYLDRRQAQGKLLENLADDDGRDSRRYPDFEAWYSALPVQPSRDAARYQLRQEIRRFIADERGRDYLTDLADDPHLQKAIREIARKIGLDLSTFEAYKNLPP